jgi:fumarylacetoacetase
MFELDPTHDPSRRSWVLSANGFSDFPIQNLPIGIFSPPESSTRAGVAIGDKILDIAAALSAGLFSGDACQAAEAASGSSLNSFLALDPGIRNAFRHCLFDLLQASQPDPHKLARHLYDSASCQLRLPALIGDYTDFYTGIHHAENVGKQFRPDSPLLPNYKHVPIGYHGRSSSIVPSGIPIRRPQGQFKAPDKEAPLFGPSQRLDYELELGIWIGKGNELGQAIPIDQAWRHLGGFCLMNDWSARDIQAWEYQPLGPFLAKNFGTTVSPWIILPEALAPFRIAQPPRLHGDPAPLPYLQDVSDQKQGAFDIRLEIYLLTPGLKNKKLPPYRVAQSNTRYMYWTVAQLIAHHTSGGCNLRPGDLLGSGTLSGPDATECGSLLEATVGGQRPILLESGEERRFLQDGDEVILRAQAVRPGFQSIGFGSCFATVIA